MNRWSLRKYLFSLFIWTFGVISAAWLEKLAEHLGYQDVAVVGLQWAIDLLQSLPAQFFLVFLGGLTAGVFADVIFRHIERLTSERRASGHDLIDAMHLFADNGESDRRHYLQSKARLTALETAELHRLRTNWRRRFRAMLVEGELVACGRVQGVGERVEISKAEYSGLVFHTGKRIFKKTSPDADAESYTDVRIKKGTLTTPVAR
jgi:hypothetical protein